MAGELFVKIPMVIMFAISLTALLVVALNNVDAGNWIIALLAVALFGFGSGLAVLARVSLKKSTAVNEELVPETTL